MHNQHTLAERLHLLNIHFLTRENIIALACHILLFGSLQGRDIIVDDILALQLHVLIASERININIGSLLTDGDTAVAHRSGTELLFVGCGELHLSHQVAIQEDACQGDGGGCGVQRVAGRHKRITLVWYHGIVDIQRQMYTLIFLDVEIYLRVGTVGCRIDITFQRQELESDGIASHLLADINNRLAGIGDIAHAKVELESHRRIRSSVELGKRIELEVDR